MDLRWSLPLGRHKCSSLPTWRSSRSTMAASMFPVNHKCADDRKQAYISGIVFRGRFSSGNSAFRMRCYGSTHTSASLTMQGPNSHWWPGSVRKQRHDPEFGVCVCFRRTVGGFPLSQLCPAGYHQRPRQPDKLDPLPRLRMSACT